MQHRRGTRLKSGVIRDWVEPAASPGHVRYATELNSASQPNVTMGLYRLLRKSRRSYGLACNEKISSIVTCVGDLRSGLDTFEARMKIWPSGSLATCGQCISLLDVHFFQECCNSQLIWVAFTLRRRCEDTRGQLHLHDRC